MSYLNFAIQTTADHGSIEVVNHQTGDSFGVLGLLCTQRRQSDCVSLRQARLWQTGWEALAVHTGLHVEHINSATCGSNNGKSTAL
jgi:hypothetical protein